MRTVHRISSLVAALAAAGASCGDVVRAGPVAGVPGHRLAARRRAAARRPGTRPASLLSDVLTIVTSPAPCTATAPCPTVFNDTGQRHAAARRRRTSTGGPTAPTIEQRGDDHPLPRGLSPGRRPQHAGRRRAVRLRRRRRPARSRRRHARRSASSSCGTSRRRSRRSCSWSNSPTIITTIADVTFYGQDQVGNDISATGSIHVDFGNFGDSVTPMKAFRFAITRRCDARCGAPRAPSSRPTCRR